MNSDKLIAELAKIDMHLRKLKINRSTFSFIKDYIYDSELPDFLSSYKAYFAKFKNLFIAAEKLLDHVDFSVDNLGYDSRNRLKLNDFLPIGE